MALAGQNEHVEVRDGGEWRLVRGSDCVGFLSDPGVKFRRAKPKRSRVQELFRDRAFAGNPGETLQEVAAREAIRAVCEYLRERCYATRATPRQPLQGGEVAKDIEREFLVPR
jgi:hypothetical protein